MSETIDWAQYWWTKVTGPQEFMNSAISLLLSNMNVLLVAPPTLPWHDLFRRLLRNNLRQNPYLGSLNVHIVSSDLTGVQDGNPGLFLLDTFGNRDERNRYRGARESIEDYLLRKEVLHHKIIWITNISQHDAVAWIRFCQTWQVRDRSDGLFILEVSELPGGQSVGWLKSVSYDALVGTYDLQLFSALMLGDSRFASHNTVWKRYGAAIASHLCEGEPMLSCRFIEAHNFMEGDPLQTMESLVHGAIREEDLVRRLWAGQLEVLFPFIEEKRLAIIDRYKDQLEELIRSHSQLFAEQVEGPDDLEIGVLTYLMRTGYLMAIDRTEREYISLLRECRNCLAHRNACSPDQVRMLLSDG